MSSKVLIEILTSMGYPVKSHSSSIDNYLADRLRKQVKKMDIPVKKKKTPAKKAAPAKKPEKAAKKPVTTAKTVAKKPATAKAKPEAKAKTEAKAKPEAKKKDGVKKPVADVAKKEASKPVALKVAEPKKAAPSAVVDMEKARQQKEEEIRQRKLKGQKAEEDKKRKISEAYRKAEEDKKRKISEAEKRKETEAAEKKRKEDERKRKEADAQKRKEEEELQHLIDEEERQKREQEKRCIVIDEATTVKEFADKLHIGLNDLIKSLIGKGIMATLNQTIEESVARDLAIEMGFEIKTAEEKETSSDVDEVEDDGKLLLRSPVVTIMGHVDHGKTSLLDMIRKTKVTEEEAGGITQKIGAYKVDIHDGAVVFLDTPGHQAFTAMRSRGAAVTDIVVLVVAADDGVMPQTVEAIHHAKAAGVPTLVAVNKIDKPGANPDKVKQELSGHGLAPEEWGGDTIFCEVSAKTGAGIDHLLEMLLLQAEVLELKANPDRVAYGTVVESKLDRGRGPVATVLVQKGTVKVGDPFVSGVHYGKVRALIDNKGKRVNSAGPSTPVEVLGFSGVPTAGESFAAVESERKAHQISVTRQNVMRVDALSAKKGHVKLENLHAQITRGDIKDLNIIIKADLQGSIEAVSKALGETSMEKVRIRILHGAVGGITETDISLAAASNAIIIGFNVRPTEKARVAADEQDVDLRLYSIIYNAIDDIKAALEGMLEPEFEEKITGRAEVRETFHITKVGTIAGSMVTSGKIVRNSEARLIRDSVIIHTGILSSLKRFKDDAKEVASGYECGIGFEKYNDIKVSDVIESFVMEQVDLQGHPISQKTASAAG